MNQSYEGFLLDFPKKSILPIGKEDDFLNENKSIEYIRESPSFTTKNTDLIEIYNSNLINLIFYLRIHDWRERIYS